MKRWTVILLLAAALSTVVVYTQLTLFVIPPIGAQPESWTLVIKRSRKLNFIDSADGVCAREAHGVSGFCRIAVLGAVENADTILLRLPYSQTLYLISTDGKKFER
jgi:hypothetical protein